MADQTYRVVFSAADGSCPIASMGMTKDAALAAFDWYRHDPSGSPLPMYGPHGNERMRVVDEQRWRQIRAMAERGAT